MTATLAGALTAGGGATAAPQSFAFHIAKKPLAAALVDLAVQADISISTRAAAGCAPQGRALSGRFTLEAALTRLLAGTGCGFRLVDARAVEIIRLSPAPLAAPAPTVVAATPLDLSELVVVATRRATPASRLAYAVSAVDRQALVGQGLNGAGDLALTLPSMTVTNLGAGRDKILLRGLSDGPLTGRTQSMVGLYLDDARLTYNAPDPDLKLVDIAQVEVLRGPQGALYGAGSLGGVLHLITEPPDPAARAGWVSVTVAATRGGAPSRDVEAMLNLPVLKGRGAVRLVAYRDVQGGYIDDVGLGLSDVNRTARTGGRLAATLDLAGPWRLSAGLVSQDIASDDTQYAVAGQGSYTRRNQVREPHDNDFDEVHLGLAGTLAGAEVKATTALVRHHLASRYDASAAPPVAVPPGPAAYDDANDISSWVSEATVASRPSARFEWLVGAFYARTRQDIDLSLTSLGVAPLVAFAEARRDHLDEAALYGDLTAPLGSALRLTVGGRVFVSDTQVSSLIRAPLAGALTGFSGQDRRTGFAPKVVLAYSRSPNWLVYLQAAEGYRAGGVNTTAPPGQGFSGPEGAQPHRLYQADELWSFEAGGRLSLADDRLRLRAAIFQARWSNIQSDQLLASGLPFTANLGDGRNLGLELEGDYRDGPLVVRGEALLNAPELDRADPSFSGRAELALAGVPDVSAGVSAHYDWPLAQGRSLAVDGRYAYVGASRLTFDAATSPRMGDYATARLAATLSDPRWRLTLAVDNLANSHGDTFAYGNPFSVRFTRQLTPQRPRTVSVTLRAAY